MVRTLGNSVGVALSRRRYRSEFFLLIYCDKFQLKITPTAKRNSYRVAWLVGLPRVACFARNPGLGKRNSVRVAAACGEANSGVNP